MKRASLLFASVLVVGLAGCKKSADPPVSNQPVTPVAPSVAQPAPAPAAPVGSGSAAGSAEDPWAEKEVKKDPIARPFFWSIEKGGKTSFVLGTIHIGVDAEQRLPKVVWDKLDAVEAFAMETDVSDPSLANMGKRASGTLKDDLGAEYWKKLEAIVGAGVAGAINNMKPMVAATLLSLRGLPQTPPMDGVLHARAVNHKKRIAFLETAASQAAILEKHMTVKALKMMLDDPQKGVDQTKQMLEAYLAGDEAKFVELSETQRKDALASGYTAAEYDQFMEDINFKRNANWIPTIEKLNATGPTFIAVGALHLIGKRSVLDLLEKRGYKVTRIAP